MFFDASQGSLMAKIGTISHLLAKITMSLSLAMRGAREGARNCADVCHERPLARIKKHGTPAEGNDVFQQKFEEGAQATSGKSAAPRKEIPSHPILLRHKILHDLVPLLRG